MEVLNLRKPAELDHVTYELSELKIILQCMPYITEMRFSAALRQPKDINKIVKIVADLFILASESGGGKLKSLSTACSYSTFPFAEDSKDMQSFFFLDLFTQLKESSSWKTALPALKPILQVAPAVWTLDRQTLEKTFALTELLKLQAITKTMELTSWSREREKLRSFLNCLPYISHLCCNEQFFQSVCEVLSADSEWNPKQIAELLRSLGFSISLIDMLPSRLCKAVGNVFKLLDKENISLSLLPRKISCQGCAYLFSIVKKFQTLRVNEIATANLARLAISDKEINAVTVEELSLVLTNSHLPERALCQLLSNLTSLLRVWTVHNLNLSEFKIEPHWLICLLCHQGPLSINDGVKLNLLNSVIPSNETDSIVKLLHRVSDLRVDRKLLLNFLHASKDMEKQGYSVSSLLTALNHKLDFSCSASLGSGRSAQENRDLLTMSRMDFTAISSAIKTSTCDTELILYDFQAEDSALEILFPILHKVHLRLGKSLLCQILTLISNAPMAMSLQWASSLSKALGKDLNLSDIPLNYRTCESLQLVLDDKEELTHLNLSYCQITDACLDLLLPHLHKIMILDLTGNDITDKGVLRLHQALDENSFTKTICLCDNQITEMAS
ncbi:uncharacterized protein LOC131543411 isoform X2 [Onychostoma macrolepis]|uniref:uncharacterized protein LOC131543411 isoform X2 n=1 Tax=Onychostoma macrolepis TaxID=369639 RepID=UPI00272BC7AC|nr:uncharacterized protein LOC131543411 isoform X2 [Onychostoma macrolepis]